MNAARIALMPSWPARMTADVAAMYMCVSVTTFLTRYRDHGWKEGGNTFWARAQLDREVARQAGLPQSPGPAVGGDDSWDDVR